MIRIVLSVLAITTLPQSQVTVALEDGANVQRAIEQAELLIRYRTERGLMEELQRKGFSASEAKQTSDALFGEYAECFVHAVRTIPIKYRDHILSLLADGAHIDDIVAYFDVANAQSYGLVYQMMDAVGTPCVSTARSKKGLGAL